MVDLDTDYQLGMPELRITPNRARISDIGVSVDDVATTLNALVGGVLAGKYSTGGRRLDVRVKLLAAQRSRPEDLARLQVRTRSGELVPLSSLVSYDEQPALQAITRRDRERAVTIYANVAPGHAQDEALKLVEKLGKDLPVGYRAVLGGASVAFRESSSSLLFALFMGILIAYMVLASQFNSYLHPVTVITILPLSIAGAAFALWSTGQTLEHLLHDRPAAADGHRQEELDHPGRLRQQVPRGGLRGARGHGEGRPHPPAAHRHDRRLHPDGRHPAGPGHRPGLGDPHAHGDRHHRRPDPLHRPQPGGGPGFLCGHGRAGKGLAEKVLEKESQESSSRFPVRTGRTIRTGPT